MGQDLQHILNSWVQVGHSMSLATQDVATQLGGEEFAKIIAAASLSETQFPHSYAIKTIEQFYPGSLEMIMKRTEAIEEERRAKQPQHRLKRYGKALLSGFRHIGIGIDILGSGVDSMGNGIDNLGNGMSHLGYMPSHRENDDHGEL